MKKLIFLLFLIPGFTFCQPTEKKIKRDDLLQLTGGKWNGKLIYYDPASDTTKTIPAEMSVRREGENLFLFEKSFPDSALLNATDTIVLNKTGTMMGAESVIQRTMKGDTVVIVTEPVLAETDSFPQYRYTYKFHPHFLLITRIEKADAATGYREKSRFRFTRE